MLYPNALRDLLIRIAQGRSVRAKWTEEILDETFRSLKEKRPDLDPDKLDRTRRLMNSAVRDCLVTGYEPLVPMLELPDADARRDPPTTVGDVLSELERNGLLESAAALRT
ncbi:hypothetical protein FPZ12_000770 [Amycolatopsis acidicola]|uniref:VapC50 C-terminal domain-containing protein n=1 Tax=Amycolatopsis acidicola TaxID=2596893 RepID=A0A5N0VK64_9PSEU|nr:hypothetical protein [Amycolatopsis acidicola]KAA9166777.1 hypothetical protein FPZ12_000770 [Amycolatopsis acidicola]